MNILVTGGAGYIGSHIVFSMIGRGHNIIILDDLRNSNPNVMDALFIITGKKIKLVIEDIANQNSMVKILQENNIDAVIHLAGDKAVEHSIVNPLGCYENNFIGSLNLIKAMEAAGVKRLVFSSSASVYGDPEYLPIDENHSLNPKSPYARSKVMIENMLSDLVKSDNQNWRIASLRFFNPVGAHISGLIGENLKNSPTNLSPRIGRVALGELPYLEIYGCDLATKDGTGVRDYIHVLDLAEAHNSCLEYLIGENSLKSKFEIFNIGTGVGYSVLDVLHCYERVSFRKVPFKFMREREGDPFASYAAVGRVSNLLGWKAKLSLEDMCSDAWRFQKNYQECM